VLSSSSYFLLPAARIARDLGLTGADPMALEHCSHKGRQRARLASAGIAQPQFRLVHSIEEARAAAAKIGYPVVIKPVEGSGKVGVSLAPDEPALIAWMAGLCQHSANERGLPVPREFLVEQYFEGREFSVEAFHGSAVAVFEKRCQPPRFVEEAHVTPPADLPRSDLKRLTRLACEALVELDLAWGAAHVELRMNAAGEMVLVEVNPRLAGGNLPALVLEARGIDLIESTLLAALGATVQPRPLHDRAAAIAFLFAPRQGVLTAIDGIQAAWIQPGVRDVQAYRRPGERLDLHGDFRDRIGHVVVAGSDAAVALERALATVKILVPEVQP
jgi:biotin carboxylase